MLLAQSTLRIMSLESSRVKASFQLFEEASFDQI